MPLGRCRVGTREIAAASSRRIAVARPAHGSTRHTPPVPVRIGLWAICALAAWCPLAVAAPEPAAARAETVPATGKVRSPADQVGRPLKPSQRRGGVELSIGLTPRRGSSPTASITPPTHEHRPWLSSAGVWGALGVFLLAAVVAARVTRRRGRWGVRRLPKAVFTVLGRRALDQRHVVYLLRCGSRILVVGCSPNGVHAIGEINDPVEVDHLAGLCQAEQEPHQLAGGFQALWQAFPYVGSRSQPADTGAGTPPASPQTPPINQAAEIYDG